MSVYLTKQATESQLDAIVREIEALGHVPNDVIDYVTCRTICSHLVELRKILESDLRYFQEREYQLHLDTLVQAARDFKEEHGVEAMDNFIEGSANAAALMLGKSSQAIVNDIYDYL